MNSEILQESWDLRAETASRTEAIRIFYGPGEVDPASELVHLAIEKFQDDYWIFEWERDLAESAREEVIAFLRAKGARSIVYLRRPRQGIPSGDPEVVHGEPPAHLDVVENGLRFRIRFQKTRHPGLFLDHEPLRRWLLGAAAANISLGRTLNTFAYTGSLSVAAAAGGATEVTTLDLSKPTIAWARENGELNPAAARMDFIYGDTFEWLPKMQKRGDRFETVILDPPSFSRGNKGSFSTGKDLPALHALALGLLSPRGHLITSINSAKLSPDFFMKEIEAAAREARRRLSVIRPLAAPPDSFPNADYLKGWIFRVD